MKENEGNGRKEGMICVSMVFRLVCCRPTATFLAARRPAQGLSSIRATTATRSSRGLQRLGLQIVAIPNTHADFDHILGVNEVRVRHRRPFGCTLTTSRCWRGSRRWCNCGWATIPAPCPRWDGHIQPGDAVASAPRNWRSPCARPLAWIGGLYPPRQQEVIAGDVLFAGSVGRFDLPGVDGPTLLRSIRWYSC